MEVYKTAKDFINRFGTSATVEAAMRSDSELDCGDEHAASQWNKVMHAIEDLGTTGFTQRHRVTRDYRETLPAAR